MAEHQLSALAGLLPNGKADELLTDLLPGHRNVLITRAPKRGRGWRGSHRETTVIERGGKAKVDNGQEQLGHPCFVVTVLSLRMPKFQLSPGGP